jgi:hypothetical protein
VDASEARQAHLHEWRVEVLETIAFTEGRPLNTWSRRLKRLYERFEEMDEPALKRAARAILLHTLGDFHGRGRFKERPVRAASGAVVLREGRALSVSDRPSHPEWTAAVWSRCRYRLTKYLLQAPRESLLGCYIDAAYTIADPGWGNPAWGQGTYGHMRLKGRLTGPLAPPREERELFDLSHQAAAALGEEAELLEELEEA